MVDRERCIVPLSLATTLTVLHVQWMCTFKAYITPHATGMVHYLLGVHCMQRMGEPFTFWYDLEAVADRMCADVHVASCIYIQNLCG